MKKLFRSKFMQRTIGGLAAMHMGLVRDRTRWEVRGREHAEPIWNSGEGVIGCVWHSRVFFTPAMWPRDVQQASILVSRSPDGYFTRYAAAKLGIGVVLGGARNPKKSKEKGSIAAFRGMDTVVREGGCMAVTPDGPRGPRMRCSMGVIRLAMATGAPILPGAAATTRAKRRRTWDRLVIPLPFARGGVVWKAPIRVPADADSDAREAARLALETALTEATNEADAAVGAALTEPAPRRGDRPAVTEAETHAACALRPSLPRRTPTSPPPPRRPMARPRRPRPRRSLQRRLSRMHPMRLGPSQRPSRSRPKRPRRPPQTPRPIRRR